MIYIIYKHLYPEVTDMLPYAEYVLSIKAMADVTRLEIIDMLSCGEMCACKILKKFNISQPTLSYHMKILTESGLVNCVRDGAWMRYSLNNERVEGLMLFMNQLTIANAECPCSEM
jgi:ArsR family transcriptional regulator, arsenate/arsenite/antimonite-responsive transcriptional repressor